MRATEPDVRGLPRLATADTSLNSMLQEREPAQGTLVPRIIHGTQRSLEGKTRGQKRRQLGADIFRSPITATNPHDCNVDMPFPFVRTFSTQL